MDSIGPNPQFDPTQIYTQTQANSPRPEAAAKRQNLEIDGIQPRTSDFSSVFDDDELSKLQNNLERIASLAEQALQRIDS